MKKQNLILFAVLLSFILLLSGCKKSEEADVFDIRGTWGVVYLIANQNFTGQLTFSGNVANGTVSDGLSAGTYTVNGNQVNFSINLTDNTYGRIQYSHTGTATSDNQMNGSCTLLYQDYGNQTITGTWTCSR